MWLYVGRGGGRRVFLPTTGRVKSKSPLLAATGVPRGGGGGWGGRGGGGGGGGGGHKGIGTLLLKGKVQIPPPAGQFIDPPPPLSQYIFIDPPLSQENVPHTASRYHKICASKMQNYTYFNFFQNSLKKCIFRALFAILQYPTPPPPRAKCASPPPPRGKILISPLPAGLFSTPLLAPTTVPKYACGANIRGSLRSKRRVRGLTFDQSKGGGSNLETNIFFGGRGFLRRSRKGGWGLTGVNHKHLLFCGTSVCVGKICVCVVFMWEIVLCRKYFIN